MYEQVVRSLIRKASKAPVINFKHAACVIRGDKILGTGTNRGAYYFSERRYIAGIHAEVAAIRNAVTNLRKQGKRLRAFKIVVVRSNHGNSLPCSMCVPYISRWGCSRVIATNGNDVVTMKVQDVPRHDCLSAIKHNSSCEETDDSDESDKLGLSLI